MTPKTLDLSKLPSTALGEVAEMMGWDPEKEVPISPWLEKIQVLSEYEFLDYYLRYHGIIGFTGMIWFVCQCLKLATESAKEEKERVHG
jgi:hypothetical protein